MLPRTDSFTPVPWRPLSGFMDERSQPDEMAAGTFRLIQNFEVVDERKLCRRRGWSKFRSVVSGYNNDDLHDQLLSLQTYYANGAGVIDPATVTTYPHASCSGAIQTRATGRQPISFLFPMVSGYGARKLLAGTESKLLSYNENTGNWKILADGYGTGLADGTMPRRRFYGAQAGDYLFVTNDFNKPVGWAFGGRTFGCNQQAMQSIPDLDVIGLSRASVIWSFKNCLFLADVEMDGKRYRNRVIWSDYKNGFSFDPAKPESITGIVDLEEDEEVIGGMELGNVFLIYTNKRIWDVTVGGASVFNFEKRTPISTQGMLFYRNTLVSDGNTHYYIGYDGVWSYDLYSTAPKRVEWMHKSTKTMMATIDNAACDNHIGHFNPDTKEIWFSYATTDSTGRFPNKTLAINIAYGHSSTIDHGFTAIVRFEPTARGSLREFFTKYNICTAAELNALGYGYVKEGLPRVVTPPTGTRITAIRNNVARVTASYAHETSSLTSLTIGTGTPKIATLDGSFIRDGDTTNGSPAILNITTTNLVAGMAVSGTGIPANTTILTVGSTSITLSQNATATASAVSLTMALPGVGIVAVGYTMRLTNGATWMEGTVSSLAGANVTFTPTTSSGSGTFDAWVVTVKTSSTVEDWTAAAIAGSLCEKFGALTIADLCGTCKSAPLTVMASSTDWCLKELVQEYYRERCTNPAAIGTTDAIGYTASVGTYALDGFDSILRPGPDHFGRPEVDKHMNYIEFNVLPEVQTIPNKASLRVGMSAEPVDPNDPDCPIMWQQEDDVDLECDPTTAAEHLADGTRPDSKQVAWAVHMIGPYLFWELKIAGTGGGACFSSVVRKVKLLN